MVHIDSIYVVIYHQIGSRTRKISTIYKGNFPNFPTATSEYFNHKPILSNIRNSVDFGHVVTHNVSHKDYNFEKYHTSITSFSSYLFYTTFVKLYNKILKCYYIIIQHIIVAPILILSVRIFFRSIILLSLSSIAGYYNFQNTHSNYTWTHNTGFSILSTVPKTCYILKHARNYVSDV